jgi:hypothetical protein
VVNYTSRAGARQTRFVTGFRSKSTRHAWKIALANGLNEFFLDGQSQGGSFSAASRLIRKGENAASQLRSEAECHREHRERSA